MRKPGTVLFVNDPWPVLDRDAAQAQPRTIGPYCRQPYVTDRFFHISSMSFGALSKPAVQALSHGAAKAGIWLNTGEGGLAPLGDGSGYELGENVLGDQHKPNQPASVRKDIASVVARYRSHQLESAAVHRGVGMHNRVLDSEHNHGEESEDKEGEDGPRDEGRSPSHPSNTLVKLGAMLPCQEPCSTPC